MLGIMARAQGRIQDSITAYESAMEIIEKTEYRKDRRLMAFMTFALALSVEKWGDYYKAERLNRRVHDNLGPDSEVGFNRLGLLVSWSTVVERLASMYQDLGREAEAKQIRTRHYWCDQWPGPTCESGDSEP